MSCGTKGKKKGFNRKTGLPIQIRARECEGCSFGGEASKEYWGVGQKTWVVKTPHKVIFGVDQERKGFGGGGGGGDIKPVGLLLQCTGNTSNTQHGD